MLNKKPLLLLALVAPVLLSACSTKMACLEPQPYMQAEQFPLLESPKDLVAPVPAPEMAIPEVYSGQIGAYDKVPANAGGKVGDNEFARCLEAPPAMPNQAS